MDKELEDYQVNLIDRAKNHYRLWNTEKTIDIHEAMKTMEQLVIRIETLERSLDEAADIFLDRQEYGLHENYAKIARRWL